MDDGLREIQAPSNPERKRGREGEAGAVIGNGNRSSGKPESMPCAWSGAPAMSFWVQPWQVLATRQFSFE